MESKKSRLEEILGDIKAIEMMLEGTFNGWDGSYDILMADTGEYLFGKHNPHPKFRPFCAKLRENTEGERLCHNCDIIFAHKVAKNPHDTEQQIYECHAHLTDIAAPIVVKGEHIATVFCGQVRSKAQKQDSNHFKRVKELEESLQFQNGELSSLAEQIPQKSREELETMRDRISFLTNYIVSIANDRLELERANRYSTQRIELSKTLEQSAQYLTTLTPSFQEFWEKVSTVLEGYQKTIGALCSMLLMPVGTDENPRLLIKSVSGLPTKEFIDRTYPFYDRVFNEILLDNEIRVVTYDNLEDPETISGSIRQYDPDFSAQMDKVILVRITLENEAHHSIADKIRGILLFCVNEKVMATQKLPIKDTEEPTRHLATLISAAYHNARLYRNSLNELKFRRGWLIQVGHQLIAPLHGIMGYADNLRYWQQQWQDYFEHWDGRNLDRWQNAINSLVWTSAYAARLARNLQWFALSGRQKQEELNPQLVESVYHMLIIYVRDFQGLARERELRGIRVADEEALSELNDAICIDEDLFRQAVGNLLDNAVKYSTKGTEIIVTGGVDPKAGWGNLKVINEGIRLREEDCDRIFEPEYRSREALTKGDNAPGTGIGLTVAREIIKLHQGRLIATPSEKTQSGWKTVFTIKLPVVSDCT